MNDAARFRFSALTSVLSIGALLSLGSCESSSSPPTVTTESALTRASVREILKCCERRATPLRRAECVLEALHDRGVCAPSGTGGSGAGGVAGSGAGGVAGAGGAAGVGGAAGMGGSCGIVVTSISPPQTVVVGGQAPVTVVASDSNPAAVLTYAWSTLPNLIDTASQNPTTPNPSFMCLGAITTTSNDVHVTISDGTCSVTASTIVNCQGICGNGLIEPGEQCDPPHSGPDGLQCGPTCQLLTCGNGVIDPGEQCDPPDSLGPLPPGSLGGNPPPSGKLCTQTCQLPPPSLCGNGVVDPGEQCDPPNNDTCNLQCQTIPTVCGDGVIQPGETCDFPNGKFCMSCQITACGQCVFASLFPMDIPGQGDPIICETLLGTARTNCQALWSCESADLAGMCGVGAPTRCYCSDATCSAGANGICAAEFNAVAGTTDPAVVLSELNNPNSLLSQIHNEMISVFHAEECGMVCQ